MRRASGSWLDAEAVVNNLLTDPNVRATVVTVRDVSERKRFENQLTHQAFHDALTGLANRALFRDRLAHALARRERDGTVARRAAPRPRRLQDRQRRPRPRGRRRAAARGRRAAQRAACAPATRRPGSAATSSRWCSSTCATTSDAVHAAERIIAVLGEPFVIEGKEIVRPGEHRHRVRRRPRPATADELLRNADVAMYVAKTDGKGRVRRLRAAHARRGAAPARPASRPAARARQRRVRAALPADRVDWRPAESVGVEALVRWQHPTRGLMHARRVHPAGRGDRADRAARAVGAASEACRQVADVVASTPRPAAR